MIRRVLYLAVFPVCMGVIVGFFVFRFLGFCITQTSIPSPIYKQHLATDHDHRTDDDCMTKVQKEQIRACYEAQIKKFQKQLAEIQGKK